MLAVPLLAAAPGGSEPSGRAPEGPVLIHDVYELQNMSRDLNGSYALANDIDAIITRTWNGGQGFLPIGNSTSSFNGGFNGRGHTITGLFINRSRSYHVGLFSTAGSSSIGLWTISNVSLVSANITGEDSVGGLVGGIDGNISNCSVFGTVTGKSAVGGLAGVSSHLISDDGVHIIGQSPSIIMNCRTGGFVNGRTCSGGIVGLNYGVLVNCSSLARLVQAEAFQAGGIAGENSNGTIMDCLSTGMVIGELYVGGLVGSNSGEILNCRSSSPVWGMASVGGFVGWNGAESRGDQETIANCASTGPVYLLPGGYDLNATGVHWDIGGFVGLNLGRITRSYSTGLVTGDIKSGGFAGQNMDWDLNFPQEALISECYCQCTVNGTDTVGGFVGNNTGILRDVYSAGAVEPGIKNGGFAALNTGVVESSYWDNETAGVNISANGTGENTSNMMKRATFEGWDFDYVWRIIENETYPSFNLSLLPDFGHAPMITTVPEVVTTANLPYEVQYYAYDAESNTSLRWELSTDASWLAMDNETGLLSGRPSGSDVGKFSVSVNVSDGRYSDGQRFILTVLGAGATLANRAPVILGLTGPSQSRVDPSAQVGFRVVASDPDGDGILYAWSENGTVLGTGPALVMTFPPGNHTVVLTVSDGGHNLTEVFDFTVAPAPGREGGRSVDLVRFGYIGASSAAIVIAAGLSMYAGTEPGKYRLLMLAIPLYTRLNRDNVLDNETRGMIRGCIISEPGIHFKELRRRLDLSNGTAVHHLATLEREGVIKSRTDGVYKRFYPAGMKLGDLPAKLPHLQAVILEVVRRKEGLSQREVADALEASYYTVHRHINRMAESGILRLERRGMTVRCYLADGRAEAAEEDRNDAGKAG
jgi:DNA-binding MarR family transcriptional regulator